MLTDSGRYTLWREGDYWGVQGTGRAVRLKDSKGIAYIAVLVGHRDVELHALDLAAGAAAPLGEPGPAPSDVAELRSDAAAGVGPLLDEHAKAAYRARIEELRAELEQAREWADGERAARAREELEAISDELVRAVGLGGRDRPAASPAERARQNVGRAIRKAIARIAEQDPALGAHLERAIHTGVYCCYRPDPEPALTLLLEPPAGDSTSSDRPAGSAPAHNLPEPLTSFIGRTRELEEVSALVRTARLVTLSGPGGSGKTRVALEVARPLAGELPGGAWLVDLSPVSEPGLLVKAVARALGVRERPHTPLADDVVERISTAELVLVLDNCEHVLDEAAKLVNQVLQSCPELHVLATSREPLGVPGEQVRRMGPLAVPPEGAAFEVVARSEAVALMLDRANAVLPDFELDPATAPLVARICRRLDGLPLAIELAAARITTLSLHDLAARLDDRFAVLTRGARTALPRQRTLAATVAWSYQLLDDAQRLLFDRLSVFSGGWTLEAAEDVCEGDTLTRADVVNGLGALVEKSLVVRDEREGGHVRYRLLDTLRHYARERLDARGETAAVRDSHLMWVAAMAEEGEPQLQGLSQGAWLDRLEDELDNLRSAIEWSVQAGDPESGLRIVSIAVGGFWLWRGHLGEGERALRRLLAHPAPVADEVRARGLLAAGRIAFQTGRWRKGARLCAASGGVWRAAGDAAGEARALIWQAMNEWGVGEPERVERLLDDSLDAAGRSGAPFERALASGIAALWWADRDVDRALQLADDAGELIEQAPSPNWIAHMNEFRAYVAFVAGEHERARGLITEALPLYRQIGNRSCGAHCLETAALVTAALGRPGKAAELLGAAECLREELGVAPPAYEAVVRSRGLDEIRARLEASAVATARDRGRVLSFEEAIEEARVMAG